MSYLSSETSKINWTVYLFLTILAGIIGSIGPLIVELWVGSITQTQAFSIHMVFIFLFLGLMFNLIIDIWYEEKREGINLPMEVFQGELAIMGMCKSLREGAGACEMKAVWCSRYSKVDLYFKEELDDLNNNRKFIVKRLINKDIVKDSDYAQHLSATQHLRDSGQYEVKKTDWSEMECIVCEYERQKKEWKAFLIINDVHHHTPVLGLLFDPANKPQSKPSLEAINSWFEKEWGKAGRTL